MATLRRFFLGIGCEAGAPVEHVQALAEHALLMAAISSGDLVSIASIELKRNEPAVLALAAHFSVALQFFSASVLERETPRLCHPSKRVFALIGCHGVAEAAALAAAGPSATLIVPKVKSAFATAAVAEIV